MGSRSLLGVFAAAVWMAGQGLAAQAPTTPGGTGGQGSPAAAPEPSLSEPSIYEQLTDAHRKRVDAAAKYYVRLDDGTCLNAFRLIRALEIRENDKQIRRDEMLEALGALRETGVEPPPPAGHVVKFSGKLPNWVEYKEFCYVIGPAADMENWSIKPRVYSDGIIVSFGSFSDVYISGVTVDFAVPRRLEETIVLVPTGKTIEGKHPVVKPIKAIGRQPTPEQLAEYLVKNKKKLIEYDIPKLEKFQPTKTVTKGGRSGWQETVTVPDGPLQHRYHWVKKEFPLQVKFKADAKPAGKVEGGEKKD